MTSALKNIIPRIKQYSKSLDEVESFVEIPWVNVDPNGKERTYIFQRNGNLIISVGGIVEMGTWEYIPTAKSLLIDRKTDKLLLKQGFIDGAIMVLEIDRNMENPFVLVNEEKLPELEFLEYLESKAEAEMKNTESEDVVMPLPQDEGGYDLMSVVTVIFILIVLSGIYTAYS